MAQHTAQKPETLTVIKVGTKSLITTEMYAYSETTLGGPTIGYVMIEN